MHTPFFSNGILDENKFEDQDRTASEAVQKHNWEERQNNCMKRLRSSWHAVLTGVLMMLLCVVTRNIFIQMQKEQASRSFFLSKEPKKWEKACRRSLNMGPDMAVVLDAEDQAFLNNMMFQFVQQHPEEVSFSVDRVAGHGDGRQLLLGHAIGLLGQRPSGPGLCCNCPSSKHWEAGLVKLLGWHHVCWRTTLPVWKHSSQCDLIDLDENCGISKSELFYTL